mmetsp:Transcript_21839/g.50218  ORF Transcript_21839/g.50218 Transcript_21839/m.50218 type:complete len:241 (-) Transcript_21839:1225-1947(-)
MHRQGPSARIYTHSPVPSRASIVRGRACLAHILCALELRTMPAHPARTHARMAHTNAPRATPHHQQQQYAAYIRNTITIEPRTERSVARPAMVPPCATHFSARAQCTWPRHNALSAAIPKSLVVVTTLELRHVARTLLPAARCLSLERCLLHFAERREPRAARALGRVGARHGAQDDLVLHLREESVAKENALLGARPACPRAVLGAVTPRAIPSKRLEGALALERHRIDKVGGHEDPFR